MRIGVVGYGAVGKVMAGFFNINTRNEVVIYDKYIDGLNTDQAKESVNKSELVFVCVPTPTSEIDGLSVDVSAVEDVVSWLEPPICIRSTIPPTTTMRLIAETGKSICFSPEYIGESDTHPWAREGNCGFLTVGGTPEEFQRVRYAYRLVLSCGFFPPEKNRDWYFTRTDPTTAELCKYMENCYLATKVAFVNQFFDIAKMYDIEWEELRRVWLMDKRVGESHTQVTKERGFGGKCLPKDLKGAVAFTLAHGKLAPVLSAVLNYNRAIRRTEDK